MWGTAYFALAYVMHIKVKVCLTAIKWHCIVWHVIRQMLEYEMATNAEKLKSIVDQGKEMAAAGHFDSAAILRAVQDFDKRLRLID